MTEAMFELGKMSMTANVVQRVWLPDVAKALTRHAACDWGDLPLEDIQENERALVEGGRLLSAYTSIDGVRFWVITEADRSATTVLLPEDY